MVQRSSFWLNYLVLRRRSKPIAISRTAKWMIHRFKLAVVVGRMGLVDSFASVLGGRIWSNIPTLSMNQVTNSKQGSGGRLSGSW